MIEVLEIDFKPKESKTLDDFLPECFKTIKENFKGNLDPSTIALLRDCWDQVSERLKQFNLSKFQKQA